MKQRQMRRHEVDIRWIMFLAQRFKKGCAFRIQLQRQNNRLILVVVLEILITIGMIAFGLFELNRQSDIGTAIEDSGKASKIPAKVSLPFIFDSPVVIRDTNIPIYTKQVLCHK